MTRRIRGLGRGRKTRRPLEGGGTGAAPRLNTALGGWPGVRITPMFGRWGYFVGETLFACFPVREKEHDLWIRLRPDEQRRALAAGAPPHRRFGGRRWIEINVESPAHVGVLLPWLRRAHPTPTPEEPARRLRCLPFPGAGAQAQYDSGWR